MANRRAAPPTEGKHSAPPASPWRASRERVREREVKREAVIRAAAHAFNRKGYHNTSLDDIAAALDVTKPTVYYYVTSKEQLLFECFVAGVEQIRTAFRAVKQLEVPARERLNGVLRHYGEAVASEFGWCMVRAEEQDLPPAMSSHIKALKSEIDQGIRRLIREGIQDGSIHPCDPKMTAFALAGALNWIAHWYRENQSMTGAEIAGAFVTIFESGLRPREAGLAAPARGDTRQAGSGKRAASRATPRPTAARSPEPRQVGSSQTRQRSAVARPGASHHTAASRQAAPRQTRPRSAAPRQAGARSAATRAGR
jgi:AcrR family transcriptional regulator